MITVQAVVEANINLPPDATGDDARKVLNAELVPLGVHILKVVVIPPSKLTPVEAERVKAALDPNLDPATVAAITSALNRVTM